MKVMAEHRQPDLFEQELALAVQPVDGEPDDPIEESEVHPALRDRPVVPDFDQAAFKAAVDRIVDGLDLDKLMPRPPWSSISPPNPWTTVTGSAGCPGSGRPPWE